MRRFLIIASLALVFCGIAAQEAEARWRLRGRLRGFVSRVFHRGHCGAVSCQPCGVCR